MVKIRERYIWAAFLLIVIFAASYFRFYYQAPISLAVSVPNNTNHTLYPYQAIDLPITLANTGSSAITNLTFGVYLNGNVSTVYKASIPSGKQTTIQFNYTPTTSGTYSITIIPDPGRLYNIVDRQAAQKTVSFTVLSQEGPAPYATFPNGYNGSDIFNMNMAGYEASILFDNYTDYLYITGSPAINDFIYPAIDVYSEYINRISLAHAYYSNYSLTSIWISGYISPASLGEVAVGKSLNLTYDGNVSVINFDNSTTLCMWYSGGWTKALASIYGKNCTYYLNGTATLNHSSISGMLAHTNVSILNYSGFSGNITYAGDIFTHANEIVYESLTTGANFSNTCYYNILNLSDQSYCASSVSLDGEGLNQFSRLDGNYSLSVWSISSNQSVQDAYNYSLGVAEDYSLPGNSVNFISAYANRCSFSDMISCASPDFLGGEGSSNLTMTLTNNYNSSIRLNSISCSYSGNATASNLGISLQKGKNATVSVPCYSSGNLIKLGPAGTFLTLGLNYTIGAITNTSQGYAEVLG